MKKISTKEHRNYKMTMDLDKAAQQANFKIVSGPAEQGDDLYTYTFKTTHPVPLKQVKEMMEDVQTAMRKMLQPKGYGLEEFHTPKIAPMERPLNQDTKVNLTFGLDIFNSPKNR